MVFRALNDKIEHDVENYFSEIENLGGVIPAIEMVFFRGNFQISF